jgi:hypothetical protein
MAVAAIACRSRKIEEWEVHKILLQANLRMMGEAEGTMKVCTVDS